VSTVSNLSFETAGAGPGLAALWTLSVTAGAEQTATWGTATPPLDEEGFEAEWDNDDYVLAFALADTFPPLFGEHVGDGEPLETFERGWENNQGYLFELSSVSEAEFDSTPEAVEDHEEGWSDNEDYDVELGASTAASFDQALTPQDVEDHEDGWRGTGAGNDYDTVLGSSVVAIFDGAFNDAKEDFEETFQELQVTVNPATDLFTASGAHGLVAGDLVRFRLGSGALPAGVNPAFDYHVIASGITATAFKVSLTIGGATIDVTDAGAGEFYVRGDETLYWVLSA
jgi:hypothetical protein